MGSRATFAICTRTSRVSTTRATPFISFGFSRGAYTVRGLAGLIATCGIVPGSGCSEPDLRHAVKDVSFASRFAGVRLVMTRSRADSTTHEREGGHYLRVPQKPMAVR